MSVKILCLLVLTALVMMAEVKAGREIRSPGGGGWQGSGGGFGSARSLGGWSGSASGRSGGWGGLGRSGGGDYGFSGRSSGCGSGWDSSSGFRSNGGGYSSW